MEPVACTEFRIVVGRLERGDDLLEGLLCACATAGVRTGVIQGIGALEHARVGWYDPDAHRYEEHQLDGPLEILSCQGNLSERDGAPFVHAHLVVAGRDLAAQGGHTLPGCRVFAFEYTIIALPGVDLRRRPDPATSLMLW